MIKQLRSVATSIDHARAKTLGQFGMTNPQFDVFAFLAENGKVATGKAAEALNCSRGNLTGIIDRMERDGWVLREHSKQDRRSVDISLTVAGAQIYSEALMEIERLEDDIESAVETSARAMVRAALTHLTRKLA